MSDESPTLPQRMRAAADTLDEANTRIGGPINGHWRPSELRGEADQIEAEEREAEALKDQATVLARDLRKLVIDKGEPINDCARQLIENGWRKGGAA